TSYNLGYDDPPNRGLNYSIVDMTINGGEGDVISKNVNLLPRSDERLVGIRACNDSDYWVISHGLDNDSFYVYAVTTAGVKLSQAIAIGLPQDSTVHYETGYLKASPNRTLIAMVAEKLNMLQLFSFDPQLGIVSKPLVITLPFSTFSGFYGA